MYTGSKHSTLAFFRNTNVGERDIVIVRNYGAVMALVLDDGHPGANSVIRILSEQLTEFTEHYSDSLIADDLLAQYADIELYLSQSNLAFVGPLTAARAAMYMRNEELNAKDALDKSAKRGEYLVQLQAARVKLFGDISD